MHGPRRMPGFAACNHEPMESEPEVCTTDGVVRGRQEGSVAVFRGIPYAQPPVGPNRFAAPAPVESWNGVRPAVEFGPGPPRPSLPAGGEDWLTLAMWTPDIGRVDLPVVVWISGGAYLNCTTANRHFDGATLAATGIVVVSVDYRVGVEGFARFVGAPDNRGLLDQVAALRWVQDNVSAFGGNPDNVTVLGQSAGAGSIAALLVMPLTKGLFRRAILQSLPGTFFTTDLAGGIAAEITSELGRSPRVDDLTDLAPAELVEAARSVTARILQYEQRWGSAVHTTTPFAPIVDGEILPASPWSSLTAGTARGVDLLVGHTRDEFRVFAAGLGNIDDAGVDALVDGLSPTPGANRYRATYAIDSPQQLREMALSDWLFRMPTLHLAEAASTGGARVWLYELCWDFGTQGASHGLDTLLLFGTADIGGEVTAAGPTAVAQMRQVSRLMRDEQLSFAATGDPGWERFQVTDCLTRVYDTESVVERYPEGRSRQLWHGQRFGVLDPAY